MDQKHFSYGMNSEQVVAFTDCRRYITYTPHMPGAKTYLLVRLFFYNRTPQIFLKKNTIYN